MPHRHDATTAIRSLKVATTLLAVSLAAGCASLGMPAAEVPDDAGSTMLLVSLGDGSVVRQDIELDADICMKTNGDSQTTCFSRGAPIMSADQTRVIGYEMVMSEIQLVANQ